MTTDTRNGQTEVEILTRIGIPLVLGDRTWRVKPRTMKQDREWLAAVQERIIGQMIGWAIDATLRRTPSPSDGPTNSPSTSGVSARPKKSTTRSRTGSSRS